MNNFKRLLEKKETLLYGVRKGEPDWKEEILLSPEYATPENIEKVKKLAAKDFRKFRVAVVDLSVPPDFTKGLRKK